jgi:hypothetical protein
MKGNNFFWISFADLMTSLFFLLLVLFGISTYITQKDLKKLAEIENINKATKELPPSYFEYSSRYKRYKLKREIHFKIKSDLIDSNDINYLEGVGKEVESLIIRLNNKVEFKKRKVVYLIIIEGMASNFKYKENFELSYKRALSVYRLWKRSLSNNSILFKPDICEIQITGSGEDGIREFSGENEYKNQQILIHIIPKYDFEINK